MSPVTFFVYDDEHITPFLQQWAPELRQVMRVVRYRDAARVDLDSDTYVFSDLERPTWLRAWPKWRAFAHVRARGRSARVLNAPWGYRGRSALSRLLHARGDNAFAVYRLGEYLAAEARGEARHPVFVMRDRDHLGPRSGLLYDASEVRRAVAGLSLKLRTALRPQLVVTELCDCRGPDGLTRKYGVMRIGDAFIPRHVLFSRHWMVKYPDVVTPDTVEEERAFIEHCPHLSAVKRAFDLAGIQYGRIDYGVVEGRIQVWEINTAPSLFPPRERVSPLRMPLQEHCAAQIRAAFDALASRGSMP